MTYLQRNRFTIEDAFYLTLDFNRDSKPHHIMLIFLDILPYFASHTVLRRLEKKLQALTSNVMQRMVEFVFLQLKHYKFRESVSYLKAILNIHRV